MHGLCQTRALLLRYPSRGSEVNKYGSAAHQQEGAGVKYALHLRTAQLGRQQGTTTSLTTR